LPDAVARAYAEKALPLLDAAIRRDARDLPALQSKVGALWSLNQPEDALSACDAILADWPESEVTLHAAGNLSLELNRPDSARTYLERAVRANPWRWQYHQGLAIASFRKGEWERGARECSQSLQLNPANAASRSLLIQCRLGTGDKAKANAEFEVLLQHTPEDRRPNLRQWYQEQLRRFQR
jgi:tetratricopeptide (TPR) repeat protein